MNMPTMHQLPTTNYQLPFFGLLLMFFSLTSCQNDLSEKQAKVMEIHDDAMARYGKIEQCSQLLDEKKDNIGDDDSSVVLLEAIIDAKMKLSESQDGMENWMNEFKTVDKLPRSVDPNRYLDSQMVKISQVRENMLSSIQTAEKLTQ
jgi:hypothetical protein